MRSLELMPNEDDWLEGPDVLEVQTALRFRGAALDGIFGPDTALAVQKWKWRFGFPKRHVNGRLGLQGRAWLLRLAAQPADFRARADQRKGVPLPGSVSGYAAPLPVGMGHGSEFRVVDAEGAPGPGGKNYHAAKDWFAPGGTPVRAPIGGRVCEAKPSLNDTGQVFGGTVKIEERGGRVWVFRHVVPKVSVEERVSRGQLVATVTAWKDGPPHAHIELWKTLAGGYRLENMIDPVTVLR
ncbi:peptidoglycan DD-metalloendopeptidase family protein [Miltoncostaea oceani]|uniref:peptidoglycan DD-metalloendopeptidase family protein n=1 Tax=Miltoncostaea oceani TaxID=2843216 RepID=UPI001C3D23A0|nr:peptidoglycan DD-metalloendopeptidase family protein [Miltoncostaea oceani]